MPALPRPLPPFRRSLPAAIGATALAFALAACGAGGDGSGGGGAAPPGAEPTGAVPTATADEALAAQVPDSVKADGKIMFGVDASYAPNEFTDTDGTTIIGMDIDLGTAVAQKLGLTAEFQNSNFSGIVAGVEGARFEMAMSSITINDERIAAVDMISYFSAGTSLAVASGNPDGITAETLCGRAVGVQAGTIQVQDLATRNEACTASGQQPIAVTELAAQTDVTLALTANRVAAMLVDSPPAAYAVTSTDGAVEVVGEPYDSAPYGIAIAKEQGQFSEAIRGAVQALIDDGTYAEILEKWNVADGAIPTAEIVS